MFEVPLKAGSVDSAVLLRSVLFAAAKSSNCWVASGSAIGKRDFCPPAL